MPTKRVKSLPEVRKLHLGIGNIKRRTGCAGSPKCVLTETHGGFSNLILFLIRVYPVWRKVNMYTFNTIFIQFFYN